MAPKKKSSAKAPAPAITKPPAHLLDYPCVEKGIWTPIPKPLPRDRSHRLKFKEIDAAAARAVKERGSMTFHSVGCSGCFAVPEPGLIVGNAMAAQVANPQIHGGLPAANKPSFFYHLGDIVYKADNDDPSVPPPPDGKDQNKLYAAQFYAQYAAYKPEIFAIPGNHDSKSSKHDGRSAITHFLENFCDSKRRPSPDARKAWRKTMTQPFPYWLLETPVAYLIGLATNDINGGQLDDPMGSGEPQFQWLLATLRTVKAENDARTLDKKTSAKAVILALHYPPFSGAADFPQRGNPNLGPTPRPSPGTRTLAPLGTILHHAFHQTQQYPDVVLSAHAHLYQRLTYSIDSGRQIPYVIAGSGGHYPVEVLNKTCAQAVAPVPQAPFPAVFPPGLLLPAGDNVRVVSFNTEDFGFYRVTVNLKAGTLTGEFFAVHYDSKTKTGSTPKRKDVFVLDLKSHTLQ